MPSIKDVERETKVFLARHWQIEKLDTDEVPFWSRAYSFQGTCPNQDRPGCYALLDDKEVIYIGVGASRGHGIYEGCGLGHRLNGYSAQKRK
jgi:hypothetical protein